MRLQTVCVNAVIARPGLALGLALNKLFNTLITAAIRDKSTTAVNFGMGTGTGMISGMLA